MSQPHEHGAVDPHIVLSAVHRPDHWPQAPSGASETTRPSWRGPSDTYVQTGPGGFEAAAFWRPPKVECVPVQPCSLADVLDLTGNDPFVRSSTRYRSGSAWRDSRGSVAWTNLDPEGSVRQLAALGEPPTVAELVATVLRETDHIPRLSLPRGTFTYLPTWIAVDRTTDWDFRSTTAPPPQQAGEDRVGWLDDGETGDIKDLLTEANPETSTWPGEPKARRWAGIRGRDEHLDVCLADTSGVEGVGHFSAISTRPEARGRGLASAVTAWATRQIFVEGYDVVTLGMYADNVAAQRTYGRLGFIEHHRFTSGVLAKT